MRTDGAQIVCVGANFLVHETVIAGDVDASVSLKGRTEFVVVEKRI